ncbi:MAG: porin [Rhodocyclaceae bacterium]|nr:porin [Rhodocyclaceae bacterium]
MATTAFQTVNEDSDMSNNTYARMRPLAAALAVSGLTTLALPVRAADSDELESLKQTVREMQRKIEEMSASLDQKVKVVERKQELAEEDAAKRLKDAPVVTASGKGFSFRSADGGFEMRFRGLAQLDYRSVGGDAIEQIPGNSVTPAGGATNGVATGTDGFSARRIRPWFEGTLHGGKYGFRFMPEFGLSGDGGAAGADNRRNNTVRVADAFFDVNVSDAVKFRIGKHKTFVGLEFLQRADDIKFLERSYVTNAIIPTRDFGVTLFGDVLNKKVSYAVGVFNGVADGGEGFTARDENNDKDFTWRLFATPFAGGSGPLAGLGFGVAGTWAPSSDTNSLTAAYRTPGGGQFFRYQSAAAAAGTGTEATQATVSDGNRMRIAPQAYYYKGPFGLLAEWAQVRQDVAKVDNTGARSAQDRLQHRAWQVATTWLLTGEDASFRGIKPNSPVRFGEKSGWGAWELGLRYQAIDLDRGAATYADTGNRLDGSTSPGYALGARTWDFGLTWYHNENAKFLMNYEYTTLDDLVRGGTATSLSNRLAGDTERFLSFRYQVAY